MKKLLTLFTLITLTACGFHPVYGINKYTDIGVEQHLAQIQIANIPNREGQHLRNELIDRFYRNGRPNAPLYTLSIENLHESISELDITKDADATRGQLRTTATIVLRDNRTSETLINRPLIATASYNILSSEFTNRVSEQNTRENTLNDIARQAELQISLYFKKSQ